MIGAASLSSGKLGCEGGRNEQGRCPGLEARKRSSGSPERRDERFARGAPRTRVESETLRA